MTTITTGKLVAATCGGRAEELHELNAERIIGRYLSFPEDFDTFEDSPEEDLTYDRNACVESGGDTYAVIRYENNGSPILAIYKKTSDAPSDCRLEFVEPCVVDERVYRIFHLVLFRGTRRRVTVPVAEFALNEAIEKMIEEECYHECRAVDEKYGYFLPEEVELSSVDDMVESIEDVYETGSAEPEGTPPLLPSFSQLKDRYNGIETEARKLLEDFLSRQENRELSLVEGPAYIMVETFDSWTETQVYGIRLNGGTLEVSTSLTDEDKPDWEDPHSDDDHYCSIRWLDILGAVGELWDKRYRHIGSFHSTEALMKLAGKSADDIVACMHSGRCGFVQDGDDNTETDLVKSDEEKYIAAGTVRFTRDRIYAVSDGTFPGWKEKSTGDEACCYIDIYKLR